MKNFQELLKELNACDEARQWSNYMTVEDVVANCHRGDWLLWLASQMTLPLKPLTLAKARCAKTVIHLMNNQSSIDVVNIAEKFGLTDEVSLYDLKRAANAANANIYINAANAAANAANAAAANAATANAAAAAYAAYAAAYAAANADSDSDYAAANAKTKNQKQTADICREVFGKELIVLVNNRLKQ